MEIDYKSGIVSVPDSGTTTPEPGIVNYNGITYFNAEAADEFVKTLPEGWRIPTVQEVYLILRQQPITTQVGEDGVTVVSFGKTKIPLAGTLSNPSSPVIAYDFDATFHTSEVIDEISRKIVGILMIDGNPTILTGTQTNQNVRNHYPLILVRELPDGTIEIPPLTEPIEKVSEENIFNESCKPFTPEGYRTLSYLYNEYGGEFKMWQECEGWLDVKATPVTPDFPFKLTQTQLNNGFTNITGSRVDYLMSTGRVMDALAIRGRNLESIYYENTECNKFVRAAITVALFSLDTSTSIEQSEYVELKSHILDTISVSGVRYNAELNKFFIPTYKKIIVADSMFQLIEYPNPSGTQQLNVDYLNGVYVGVRNNVMSTSRDLESWNTVPIGTTATFYDILSNGDYMVMSGGGNTYGFSNTGEDWNIGGFASGAMGDGIYNFTKIHWLGDKFLTNIPFGWGIEIHPESKEATAIHIGSNTNITRMAYNGDITIGIGAYSIYRSVDKGHSWVQVSTSNNYLYDICYDGTNFIVCGASNYLAESVDGESWKQLETDLPAVTVFNHIDANPNDGTVLVAYHYTSTSPITYGILRRSKVLEQKSMDVYYIHPKTSKYYRQDLMCIYLGYNTSYDCLDTYFLQDKYRDEVIDVFGYLPSTKNPGLPNNINELTPLEKISLLRGFLTVYLDMCSKDTLRFIMPTERMTNLISELLTEVGIPHEQKFGRVPRPFSYLSNELYQKEYSITIEPEYIADFMTQIGVTTTCTSCFIRGITRSSSVRAVDTNTFWYNPSMNVQLYKIEPADVEDTSSYFCTVGGVYVKIQRVQ